MPKTYRLGVIGVAKSHILGFMRHFKEMPNVEWVAIADVPARVPEKWEYRSSRKHNLDIAKNEIGIPTFYDDYNQMLDKERFDLILFCPENAYDGEVATAIANHGVHMATEKPMGASLSEALQMARTAADNGVELFVNWPTTWSPAVRTAKDLIDQGAVGDVWEVKWRGGSMGPTSHGAVYPDGSPIDDSSKASLWWHQAEPGGGAALDYCCYGSCIARWYVGEPAVAAQGMMANFNSQYGNADDNAVITVRFRRAMAILEATWSTVDHGVPTGPIVYGNKGTIVVERSREKQLVRLLKGHGAEPELIEPTPLPADRNNLAKELLHHFETGEPVHETLRVPFNLDAAAILDAGMRSAKSGKVELVNDGTWQIG